MTRKDYINIAAAIQATQARIEGDKSRTIRDRQTQYGTGFQATQKANIEHAYNEQLRGVRRAAAHLADFLHDDNPAGFDPALFLRNCGYGATAPTSPRELHAQTRMLDRERSDYRLDN